MEKYFFDLKNSLFSREKEPSFVFFGYIAFLLNLKNK